MTCVAWDLDLACGDKAWWDGLNSRLRDRATDLAWAALKSLTGGLVGGCPVAARPCRKGCAQSQGWWGVPGSVGLGPYVPMSKGGFWYNVPCGCAEVCSCSATCEVALPGPVAKVHAVYIGGAPLDDTAYRIDNGRILVRQDGTCWPECQDMDQPWDGPDAFTVVYTPGVNPGAGGKWVAGLLAYEFAKACNGDKCRLPSSVVSLSRQGVSMEFDRGMFAGGHTGIREVDAWLLSVNPNHLVQPPRVWSPDVKEPRYTDMTADLLATLTSGPFGLEFADSDFAVRKP